MGLLETQAFPGIEHNSCLLALSWTRPFLPKHGLFVSLPPLQSLDLYVHWPPPLLFRIPIMQG